MCFSPRRIPKHLILEAPRKPGLLERHWVKLVGTATFVLLALALADIAKASATDFNPKAVDAGSLAFKHADRYVPATHLESDAQVDINGMIARLVLTQHFKNTTDQWQEAVYTFPLQESSAVNRMVMRIGERTLVARIREKSAAKKAYREARAAGKSAALTEQQRPNLFTQNLANIGPGETVSIELHITQPIDYQNGRFSWRLPMTLTPRYIPGQLLRRAPEDTAARSADDGDSHPFSKLTTNSFGWAMATDAVPDAASITPLYTPQQTIEAAQGTLLNPIRVTVTLNAGLPLARVDASYHDISLYKEGELHRITTRTKQVPMDRDFELTWLPVAGQQPEAAVFSEQIEGEHYSLLMVLPSDLDKHPQHLPRDITFIVDTSGSMDGPSIVQAKASLQLALTRLNATDMFNVIEFNSSFSQLFRAPRQANRANLNLAKHFVERLHASGGTEMAPALEAALTSPTAEGWLKQVVFITDGSVGNEQQLFKIIHEQLKNARLFTVGIGAAPNSYFMRKAAQFGRGTFTHIGNTAEVAEKMGALFMKLESAVLTQLAVQWPAGIQAEVWPERLPDLYADEPLLLAAKISGALQPGHAVTLSGYSNGQGWQRALALPSPQLPQTSPPKGIATVWARAKIDALLDDKVRGRDASEVRAAVLNIALAHELLSPYTSLLAIDETPRRPADQTINSQPVTNLLPKGQTAPALMYPRTATAAPMWMIACLSALLALVIVNRRALYARA